MRLDAGVLRAWTLGIAAVAALTFAGCGGGDTKTVTASSSASGGGTSQTTSSDTGDSGGGGSVDTGDALAKKTVRGLDSKDGTVDIAVMGLKVEDRLMRLTLAFTPKYPSASPSENINLFEMHGQSVLYVSLVDPINLKRYIVVKDSNNTDLQPDEVDTSTTNGGTVTGTWTFAAPPADVDKIDVQVGTWPPFSDIEIQR